MDIFRTLICTDIEAPAARTEAATFPGGDGMLTTGLSADGNEPAAYFISSGYMPTDMIEALVPLIFEVSELDPQTVMAELGVQLINSSDQSQ